MFVWIAPTYGAAHVIAKMLTKYKFISGSTYNEVVTKVTIVHCSVIFYLTFAIKNVLINIFGNKKLLQLCNFL